MHPENSLITLRYDLIGPNFIELNDGATTLAISIYSEDEADAK